MFRFCFAEKEVEIEKRNDGFDKVDELELYFHNRQSYKYDILNDLTLPNT